MTLNNQNLDSMFIRFVKLSDKIIILRKQHGMSQEDLAEKLNISRQAISRWENGSATPDASNILQLSKLFNVTTDYLLNDDFKSDNDLPKLKETKENNLKQIMIYLITLEVMVLLMQIMATIILQNVFFVVLSIIPFVALVGGFEYAYKKNGKNENETSAVFRKNFYKISAWLGLYFPTRLLVTAAMHFYSHPYSAIIFEIMVVSTYLMLSTIVVLSIEKKAQI